jgi:drug/metabolite transporter (DMT)-like permease
MIKKEDLFIERFVYYLATGIFIFSAVIVLLLFFVEIPEENKDVVNFILGVVVGTGLTGVFQYFFGSSKGSKDKGIELFKLK